ncbi:MAG: TIGR03915 family putative DNA repair protein [Gorillibacterium sp.]|nr:TIGR03915 family putative DNA repair protein [Gorillibacterium sp.]
MSYRTDLAYRYDGSFEGLLCCVFESYAHKEMPIDILTEETIETILFETKWIVTNEGKAERVFKGIAEKISKEAQQLVRHGFLTIHPQKELLILQFIQLGFKYGKSVMDRLTDDTVDALLKAVRGLTSESHKLLGFVRFSVYDQVMAAVIEPKNEVLPLLEPHFCDRYPDETFLIYDQTHGRALVHRPGQSVIIPLDELTLPETDNIELTYRRLWKQFYDTIAIKERYNPRGQMSHMPKRYWQHLTELTEVPEPLRTITNANIPISIDVSTHKTK